MSTNTAVDASSTHYMQDRPTSVASLITIVMHVQGYKAQGEAQAFERALQVQPTAVPGIQKRTWENEI